MTDRLNWSTLKLIDVSPRLLRWRAEHPLPDSDALKLGRAIHCLILEPEQYAKRWATAGPCIAVKKSGEVCGSQGSLCARGIGADLDVLAWYCRVKGHAPPDAGTLPEGIESITAEQSETAKICAKMIAEHPVAAETLRSGHREEALEWTDPSSGVACRGRLDFLRADYVVDLKTTCKETPREFMADAYRKLYHGQLAWYHYGAIAAGRLPKDAPPPRIVTVETTEPYDVAVYEFTPVVLEAGRMKCRELLNRWIECRDAEWFPGHSPDLREFEIPRWADEMQAAEERADF